MRRRVLTSSQESWADPAAAYCALFTTARNSFWLDSGAGVGTGQSVMGASDSVAFDSASAPILETLQSGLHDAHVDADADSDSTPAGGFRLGWVGWLGYELRAATMGETVTRESRYPDAALMFVDRAIVFDHEAHTVHLLALGESWTGELQRWRDETVTVLRGLSSAVEPWQSRRRLRDPSADRACEGGFDEGETACTPMLHWRYSDDEYLHMIAECQAAIRSGEAYQLCLTTEGSLDVRPDPVETYLGLRGSSPSHHGGLIRVGDVSLLSASPEQFLSVTPVGVIETRPIKGTRRRGVDERDDEALRAELLASDKEQAENLMIVDLMRNDLSRVCVTGSVTVPSLLAVESYPHVHQLVSTVRGRLLPGLDGVDAVRACFPAGSMTGAPKRSATRILDRLEGRARGIYSGAFGYFGLDGRVDLAMVIRSIVLDPQGATIGTGGGITALSVPLEELDEVRLKAAALLAVLGAAAPTSQGEGSAGTS